MLDVETELVRTLHDEHAQALWCSALRMTGGDRGRAQDAVQEVLLRAWRHPEVLSRTGGSPRGWLMRTLRNLLIDEWRARSVRPEVITDDVPETPVSDDLDAVVQGWLVADALARLSAAHRAVIVECFYRGHTVTEAAQRLGVPVGTVKSRTHYAVRALRLILAEMGVHA